MNTINGSRMPIESVSFQQQDQIAGPVSSMSRKEAGHLCDNAIRKGEKLDEVVKLTLSTDKEIKKIADHCLARLHRSDPESVEKLFVGLFHKYFSLTTNPNIRTDLKDNLPVPCREIIETGVKTERFKGKNGRFVEAGEALLKARFGETKEVPESRPNRSHRDFRTNPPPQTLNSPGLEPDGIALLKILSGESNSHGAPSFQSTQDEVNQRILQTSLQGS